MKSIMGKTIAVVMTLAIIISLFTAPAYAYVGAMTQSTGGITAGQQDGYYYLKNDYIGFYIRPGGSLTTVPSQKTLVDVKSIGATETHVFYKQTQALDTWSTDFNTAVGASSSSVTIDSTDPANPKLKQTLTVPGFGATVTITYELVRLDKGSATGTVGAIVGHDASDDGRTWGVLASASGSFTSSNIRTLWMTKHNNFGGVGHSLQGTVRLDRFSDGSSNTYYSGPISSGLSRSDADGVSEAYTDSFSYANQFVAMKGYMEAMSWGWDGTKMVPTLIGGISGHWNNYASAVTYSTSSGSQLSVEHEFSGSKEASALWGFRDLYATADSGNIPADPVSISANATCVGIIKNNATVSAVAGANETALKSSYGSKLVAVFRGTFKQQSGSFVFTNGAAQLSPSLTATWTEGSGSFSVASNGTVTAKGVHLSAPTFKFYKPKNSGDTSLTFSFSGGKLAVGMTPGNNDAILHIDIPGATCSVEGVTAELGGGLVFSGKMSISTPAINAADITMKRLGMGWSNKKFSLTGVEASGSVDMQQLLGLDVGSASAEINSFPGEERYAFELELNVFDMFEAAGELELKRISNGALIPNTLQFKAASEVGVPLVPPVVVAELNGLGGGFSGLADTINGDFFAIPPLKLSVSAKGSVLEVIEGWYTVVIGAGYYKASLTDGTLLNMDIIDEYSWYTELSGEVRSYGGTSYSGLKVGGGMKIDLAIPNSDMPFIDAGGEFNASAFAGLDSYTSPSRAYLALAADGKIYGVVQIPASAWFLNRTLKLASAQVDLALGGQTTVNVNSTSFKNAVRDAFGNISGYGGVAYTGNLIGFPFRIYYIFQDKKVNLTVGKLGEELDPFDPSPFSVSKLALLDADTGRQVGIMVMNDNLTLLGIGEAAGSGISMLSVGTNDASGDGVAITQPDSSEMIYNIDIDASAPDTRYLAFSLAPKGGTIEEFANSLTVQKSGEASPLALVPAVFNAENEIANNDTANIVIGKDRVTLKLPSKGTWTVSSGGTAFDISCYYASPYASLDGMNLAGTALTGAVTNMNSETNYILRTYLGTEQGGTDYFLSQSGVPAGGTIGEMLSLSGSAAPTGSYYVTTVLLEEVSGDFNGDGVNESTYVTTDTFAFNTPVNYVNSEQPDAPSDVTLAAVGSELMRARWKPASGGNSADGYYIRLYRQENGSWTDTGAGYLLKASDLTADAGGYYAYDMAVTAGDANLHLEAGNTYKAGITAFRYLGDEDGDGTNDSFSVESAEAQSAGQYLPEATYPVLTYSPSPSSGEGSMKLLCVNGATQITVTSDVAADIVVTRMDTDAVVGQTPNPDTTLAFNTPADFTGALNLKIIATDADGDITVDYIGLRLDETAPLITLDSASFTADRGTGVFSVTGVTESGGKVSVAGVITGDGTNGAALDADEVTADENGIFTITGKLNPEDAANGQSAADSATLLLCASDLANNVSEGTFARVVRAAQASYTGGGAASGSSSSITADSTGSISAGSLKNAAQAAGKGGTVTVETSGGSVSVTGEGLQYLINNDCALRLTTGSGTLLIPPEVLAGLEIAADSRIEFVLGRPESFSDPELQALADAGYPVYEISILIDGKAIHRLGGSISVMLKNSSFAGLDSLVVIHALDNGVYRAVEHTLANETLSFTLDSLSHVCAVDGKTAAELLKNPFSDVAESDWFYNNVLYVYQSGLMLGTDSGAFSPHAGMTRAMAATVLHRLSGGGASYKNPFSDVPSGAWYESAVGWAAANGIAKGVGGGLFDPDGEITREQLAVMLHNYAKFKGYDVSSGKDTNILSFSDALSISDYAYAAMQWACGSGIIRGDTGGRLNPQGTVTRAEIAAMLERFIRNVEK